jgi:hypothetical protein
MALKLMGQLDLKRCPHCGVDSPMLTMSGNAQTKNFDGSVARVWGFYACKRCGGMVTASSVQMNQDVIDIFPQSQSVDESVPEKPKEYLTQAINSRSAPAGAVMLTASAVDAMLKSKGYSDGSLYRRIEKAVEDHVITPELARWAHEVRLDANDQRHADEQAQLPSAHDADRVIDFALALAQLLFVLPARIERGLQG